MVCVSTQTVLHHVVISFEILYYPIKWYLITTLNLLFWTCEIQQTSADLPWWPGADCHYSLTKWYGAGMRVFCYPGRRFRLITILPDSCLQIHLSHDVLNPTWNVADFRGKLVGVETPNGRQEQFNWQNASSHRSTYIHILSISRLFFFLFQFIPHLSANFNYKHQYIVRLFELLVFNC